MTKLYCFSQSELRHLLEETVSLYIENIERREYHPYRAFWETTLGIINGLDIESGANHSGEEINPPHQGLAKGTNQL